MPNYTAYKGVQIFLRTMGLLFWRVRAEGRDRVPLTGPLIVASTHESFLDPLLIGAYLPRHQWYMARRSLFFRGERRSRFLTWFASLWGVIEVDRDGTGIGALRGAEERLREGRPVLIFPEGTRSQDGEVQEFRPGVGLLVRRTGARVLPVSVDGTRRIWPRGRKGPRLGPGPVRIVFGDPIEFEETTDPKAIAAAIRQRIVELRAKPDGGAPGR
jgi:1-acyl-sn-glycerol-3-phosphate acyltransferase